MAETRTQIRMPRRPASARPPQRPRREDGRLFAATVTAVRDITPHMRRLTVAAPELQSFEPLGADEYLGLLLPQTADAALVLPHPDAPEAIRAAVAALPDDVRPDLRWYTVRDHRPELAEIDIDFVVHGDEGPGTRFARRAQVGTPIGIRECTALYAAGADARSRVLVGDESAIPAIARILETTPPVAETHVFIEVADAADRQDLGDDVTWIVRGDDRPGDRLVAAVTEADLPEQIDFAWVCAERDGVQRVRRHLVDDRGVAKSAIVFSGYWRLGEARG